MRVGWVMHCLIFKDTSGKLFINKPKNYFVLFLTIKYSWILSMSSFLIKLWLNEKSYEVPFTEMSVCSCFVKSFDTPPKLKLYQPMLSSALNLQILFFLRTSNSYHKNNLNLSKILYLLY